jgi:uncharacterized protein (DUF1800 family)
VERSEVAAARLVLGCRAGASRAEVMAAYRDAVRRLRPDLGAPDAPRPAALQAARDLLLAVAGTDRRRRPREQHVAGRDMTAYRRSRWGLVDEKDSAVDRRI